MKITNKHMLFTDRKAKIPSEEFYYLVWLDIVLTSNPPRSTRNVFLQWLRDYTIETELQETT